jgi:SAM-dependent methyltransferase
VSRAATTWTALDRTLRRRSYDSYSAYLSHQGAKLDRMPSEKLIAYERRYTAALVPRLERVECTPGTTVLCLGARGGAEVRAFRSLGCVAIGIDLNPGLNNPDVVRGDFHALPFGNQTFGAVFTNALDHVYDMGALLAEVRRVLMPDGRFLVEAVRGTQEGCAPGSYESAAWETVDALQALIVSQGFTLIRRGPLFDCPWSGEPLVFGLTTT